MTDVESKPPPLLLRQLILEDFKEPTVFQGLISDWKFLSWNLQDWANNLGDKLMPFRCGLKKVTSVPQWERNCQVSHLTMREFLELADKNRDNTSSSNANWFYFDYKYINEWFKDNSAILQGVNWNTFGFPEVGGEQSTFWVGSDGAHTPCHFDSYGCNLVAQVFGKKQWILFPPNASETLLPVRVPYEESSVFSKYNFYSPDVHLARGLHKAWVITLKPGEVLFVPRHWWHYVENIGTAISINTWLPLPSDKESRLEESLVRLLVSQLLKETPDAQSLLNPNEDDARNCSLQDSITLMETCMKQFHDQQLENEQLKSKVESPDPKRIKTSSDNETYLLEDTHVTTSLYKNYIQNVPVYTGDQLQHLLSIKLDRFKSSVPTTSEVVSPVSATEKLINAMCHPDVMSIVRAKLYQEFCGNAS